MACQDNGNQLVLGTNQENLSESAQCSPKTASLFNCQVAESENPTSLSGEKNNLFSPRSDISEISNMDIVVNKCELPYVNEDDSNSETSLNPTISPLTVISLDLDNDDTSFRNARPLMGAELSPLFVDTSLANFTFERFVTGNNLLNCCSQAPGYVVFRNMPCNSLLGTPRPRTSILSATRLRHAGPVSEYLEYYSRMNTPLCITVDLLSESAWQYYYEPNRPHRNTDKHQQQSSDIHYPNHTIVDNMGSVRKWKSAPSVFFFDNFQDIEDRYSLYDIVHYGTYPMCSSVKYACCSAGSLLTGNEPLFQETAANNNVLFEWHQEETDKGALFGCEVSQIEGCFECAAMQSQWQMDTNFTYQYPSMPENGPNHIYWESQLPQSTLSPSFQSVNGQFVSDPNPYQTMTETPYFGTVPYTPGVQPMVCACDICTQGQQPIICTCDECTQNMMQGVNPYPYYYS